MKKSQPDSSSSEKFFNGGLCLITDRNSCDLTCVEMVNIAMEAGVRWVQLRDKDRDRKCLYSTALHLRKITRQYDAVLVVNDYVDIAAAVDADGVHLGQDDMPLSEARKILGPNRMIGVSTHSTDEAMRAQKDGADYIGFGPIFNTDTKNAGSPQGITPLAEVRRSVDIPVVAIGGISTDSVDDVIGAGADAVAIASGLLKGNVGRNAFGLVHNIQGRS